MAITAVALTVTADNQSRAYGASDPSLTATITGFTNGETLATSDVTGTALCSTTTTATSAPGLYAGAITCLAGSLASANYDFTFVAGDMTITKTVLTVTADNQSRAYGASDPSLTATITGFTNGETLATSDVTGNPVCRRPRRPPARSVRTRSRRRSGPSPPRTTASPSWPAPSP